MRLRAKNNGRGWYFVRISRWNRRCDFIVAVISCMTPEAKPGSDCRDSRALFDAVIAAPGKGSGRRLWAFSLPFKEAAGKE